MFFSVCEVTGALIYRRVANDQDGQTFEQPSDISNQILCKLSFFILSDAKPVNLLERKDKSNPLLKYGKALSV